MICEFAALGGQLERLKYAVERGCPWELLECLIETASKGHMEYLKYAREHAGA